MLYTSNTSALILLLEVYTIRPLHVLDITALLSSMYLKVSQTKDNYISNLPAPYTGTQTGELTEHPGNTTDSNQAPVPYLPPGLEPVAHFCP